MCARSAREAGAGAHVFRDGRLTDVDPQFQQFAMNPRRAPARVRLRHRANQRPDVGGHGRSPHAASALPGPPQPEAPSVPGDDGLRLDDDERRSPSGPDAREQDPEPAIGLREPNRRGRVRCSTCSWCRNARISSWSAARDRAADRSAKNSETTREATSRAYSTPSETSINAPRTTFPVGTTGSDTSAGVRPRVTSVPSRRAASSTASVCHASAGSREVAM